MKKKYYCKQRYHGKESLIGCCLNTDCPETTFMLCAQCLTEKHLLHCNDIYSFNQIKNFIEKRTNEITYLKNSIKSLDLIKELLQIEPEIQKLLILIQKMEREEKKFQGLTEYIQKKLFQEEQFKEIHQLLKSLGDYEIVMGEDQPEIQNAPNENSDITFATKCDKLIDCGLQYLQKKQYSFALTFVEYLLHLDPQNQVAQIYKCICLKHLESYEEAIQYYDGVLNQNHFTAQYQKGLSLLKLQKQNEALSSFDNALPLSLDSSDYCSQRELKNIDNNPWSMISRSNQKYEEDLVRYIDDEAARFRQNKYKAKGVKQSELQSAIQYDIAIQYDMAIQINPYLSNQLIYSNYYLYQKNGESHSFDYPHLAYLDRITKSYYQNGEFFHMKGFDIKQLKYYYKPFNYFNYAIMENYYNERIQKKSYTLMNMQEIDEAVYNYDPAIRIKNINFSNFKDKRNNLVLAFQNLLGLKQQKEFKFQLLWDNYKYLEHFNYKDNASNNLGNSTMKSHDREISLINWKKLMSQPKSFWWQLKMNHS